MSRLTPVRCEPPIGSDWPRGMWALAPVSYRAAVRGCPAVRPPVACSAPPWGRPLERGQAFAKKLRRKRAESKVGSPSRIAGQLCQAWNLVGSGESPLGLPGSETLFNPRELSLTG